jgi:hypothetical protein
MKNAERWYGRELDPARRIGTISERVLYHITTCGAVNPPLHFGEHSANARADQESGDFRLLRST